MKSIVLNLLVLFFLTGCSSHWVTKENQEKSLSGIKIEKKYKVNVEPIHVTNYWGNKAHFVQIDGFTRIETNKFDQSLKRSMNASQYFKIVNENDAPIIRIAMQDTDRGMRIEGFIGYMLTLGTMPFPVMKLEHTVTFSLHSPDGLKIREYSYPIKTEGSLTVFTPFALLLGEREPVYTKTYMDVLVSQFISDLNRDHILINI